ncbi:MAG: hypothetical protein U1A07_09845 [Phenylobacterium sp.]|nr:hypothetical protein [Phenylobacterium sp.]
MRRDMEFGELGDVEGALRAEGVDAEAAERTQARRAEAELLDRWFRTLD